MNNNTVYTVPGTTFSAHEFIAMNEALMAKSAKVEVLSSFSRQVTDQGLQNILQRQAQGVADHFQRGLSLLKGEGLQGQAFRVQPQGTPHVGLHDPQMPAPNMNAQTPSERTILTTVLNLHKFHGTSWFQFALECTHPELRTYLIDGALMCDTMAYEIFTVMNEKGLYQVPGVEQQVMQTMLNAYPQASWMPSGNMMPMQ